jgi:hypothetical protein
MKKTKNKDTTINFLPQFFLGVIFAIVSFILPDNYGLVLPLMVFVTLFLYIFSPTVAFIYSFIFVIDPMATFKLSGIAIVPIILCFIHFILNTNRCLAILSGDDYLRKMIKLCLLFSLYQLIVSYLILSQRDFYYIFINARQWLGIWLLIPAYIFIITDRKNFFVSIIIVVFIIMVFYYLSFFGVYSFFEIREFKRTTDDDDILRFFSFDLRQITKIFVYIFPIFIIFKFKNYFAKIIVPIIGIMVFLSVLLAILRTEMFYLFMGAVLSVLISIRKFKTIGKLQIALISFLSILLVLKIFPTLYDDLLQTFNVTLKSSGGFSSDESADHRLNVQLPIILTILNSNPFFGGGVFALSLEATGHYLLFDIPVISAFAAYGIVGMLIYYSRFLVIFSVYRTIKMSQKLFDHLPVECLLTNGLLAYFITMITFKTLHINIELAFDFGMPEFGLFIGIYFALIRILKNQNKFIFK